MYEFGGPQGGSSAGVGLGTRGARFRRIRTFTWDLSRRAADPRAHASRRAARRGSGNHALRAARNTSGAWTFHDTSDPRSAFSITAHAGLTFANTPGTYTSIPATAVAACRPLCAGRSGTTAAGSVNITIELTGTP